MILNIARNMTWQQGHRQGIDPPDGARRSLHALRVDMLKMHQSQIREPESDRLPEHNQVLDPMQPSGMLFDRSPSAHPA